MNEGEPEAYKNNDAAPGSSSTVSQVLLFSTFAIALPMAILFSLELWMRTAYTGGLDVGTFRTQYWTGIYRYRILGRDVVLELYRFFASRFHDRPYIMPRGPVGSYLFYASISIVNGACLLISNFLLLGLLWRKDKGLRDTEISFYLYYNLLLAMSMAVVTPYDQMAYGLLLIGVFGTRVKSYKLGAVLVAISAVAGTLNRETEFLMVPFLLVCALFSSGACARRLWAYFFLDFILSFAVYFTVRAVSVGKPQLVQEITLGGKWSAASVIVLFMFVATAVILAARIYQDVLPAYIFFVFCSPYFITVFIGGIFRELRLIVPVILCVLCLYVGFDRKLAIGAHSAYGK